MTDTERAAIDTEAKAVIRQLNQAVERIAQTEQIRQDTATHVAQRKQAHGSMGALGRWAAGGVQATKTEEQLELEAKQKVLAAHREAIIWFLQSGLQRAGSLQATMMDIRIQREVERSKSVLYKAKAVNVPYEEGNSASVGQNQDQPQLTEEQTQLFAQENQEMLRHYEDTLSQVR